MTNAGALLLRRHRGQSRRAGLELQSCKPGVEAIRGEERGVRSLLDHASGLDDQNAIGVDDRREPVGDHERGPALHEPFERALDQCFAFRVEGRGRLVQKQRRRVLEDCARDREALPLAARQRDAALAELRIVSLAAGRR